MRSSRPDLQDVVLVILDEDTSAVPVEAPADHPPIPPRPAPPEARAVDRRPALRRWRWPLVGAVVLLVLVTANATITARGERARLAALAGVPGILAPLDGPVEIVWGSELTSDAGGAGSGGHLVGVDRGRDGRVDVVGVDVRTGETAWRVAARPPGAVKGWASCATPEPAASAPLAAAPVVACVVADEVVITAENTAGYVFFPTRARLLVIETATGLLVSDAPTDPSTTIVALGEDLVTTRIDADGRAHLARTDPRGTTERWTFVSPDPVPMDDSRQRIVTVTVVDGLVVADGGPTWVLSGDGEILDTWTPDPSTELGGQVEVLRGGRLIAEPVSGGHRRPSGTRVLDPTTGGSFIADGHPVSLAIDDGSLADLVLLRSSDRKELIAHDVDSGRVRWTIPDSAGGGTAIVGARVLRIEAGELQSLDGATGTLLWATAVDQAGQSPLLTDGRVLVLTAGAPDRQSELAAYGLDDGRRRWATAVPWDLYPVSLDRRLYGWTGPGLVGFG